jgi:hypothetical protein
VRARLQRLAARVGIGRCPPPDPGGVDAVLGCRRLRARGRTLRRARLQDGAVHR